MTAYADPAMAARAERMEKPMRVCFDGCNEADIDKMVACFVPDAVHYFPPGMYDGPFRGARKIAEKWRDAVNNLGSYWIVDKLVIDPISHQAVMEWTIYRVGPNA